MDDFNYRGKKISFWQIQGEVLDSDRYSNTHVETRGGVGRGRASSVRVNQTSHHDFWIRRDDGSEYSVQIEDVNVPLRVGQRVTVICAGRAESDRGWVCSLVNHSTGQAHEITSARTLGQRLQLDHATGISLVLALVAGAMVLFLTLPSSFSDPWRMARWDLAIIAAIAVFIWRIWRRVRRINRAVNALKEHIGNVVSQIQRHGS